jgi:hypothetical protein
MIITEDVNREYNGKNAVDNLNPKAFFWIAYSDS